MPARIPDRSSGRCARILLHSKQKLQRDLLATGRQRTADRTGGRGPDDGIRIIEIGVVQSIKHFPPERKFHSLLDGKLAVNTGIQVEIPWSEDNSVPRVAECILRGNS